MSKERPMVPDGSPKPGTEEFRRAKEAINKEGWEDNAAVIIGTKEELAQKREQLEEGRETVDLRTYIFRNAVVEATSAELEDDKNKFITEEWSEKWDKMPAGTYVLDHLRLRFKSSTGDIKSLLIEPSEIVETADFGKRFDERRNDSMVWDSYKHYMNVMIEKLGFTPATRLEEDTISFFTRAVQTYRSEKSQEEKKKGFEF